jgi:hypothetical protein
MENLRCTKTNWCNDHVEPENGGWIKIKDKLPPKNEWILCYCNEGHIKKYHVGQVKIKGNLVEVGAFPEDDDYYNSRVIPFSHWMPLPEEPK